MSLSGSSPKRKAKPMLTLIPEEEKAINHRLTIVLVGEGAREFALSAVNSEMAEAYRPKKRDKPSIVADSDDVSKTGSVGSGLEDKEKIRSGGIELEKVLTSSEGEAEPRKSGQSEGSLRSDCIDQPRKSEAEKSKDEKTSDNNLTIFCPTGTGKDLARLRLHPCEKFSDSLPLQRDKAVASNTIVALLFWRVEKRQDATSGTIGEWYSRMAEINHMPAQFRPNTVVLPFETDDAQDSSLREFVDKQAGKVAIGQTQEDSEDAIMEALQELAEDHIKHHRGHRPDSKQHAEAEISATAAVSHCCSMM